MPAHGRIVGPLSITGTMLSRSSGLVPERPIRASLPASNPPGRRRKRNPSLPRTASPTQSRQPKPVQGSKEKVALPAASGCSGPKTPGTNRRKTTPNRKRQPTNQGVKVTVTRHAHGKMSKWNGNGLQAGSLQYLQEGLCRAGFRVDLVITTEMEGVRHATDVAMVWTGGPGKCR